MLQKDLSFFIENAFDGAKELNDFSKSCSKFGVKTKFNPFMIRGFSYYTGTIFEILIPGKSAIVGGGRYDNSIGKYISKTIPAVGISFSIEALMGICEEELKNLETENIPKIEIISIKQDKESIKLLRRLRKEEISSIISFDKPGKSIEYANAYNIPFVLFIGEEEAAVGKYKLKNMITGAERLVTEKELIDDLKENQ
jgi:histidyl-tRNA synthetase